MPNEGLPISQEVLSWARERAGFTVEQMEQKFKNFAAWEAGDVQPTYAQLEQIATKLHLPIAAFFFPKPPKLPPIRDSFRTLPDAEYNHIPSPVRQMLNKAKALQLNLAELTGGQNPSERFIARDLRFDDNISAEAMADEVRRYIGITLIEQKQWGGDTELALKEWRKAIQGVGIFVFKDAFHSVEYCGFSLYDERLPLIYVNNSNTKTRQIFTLFHELAHIVLRTSGVDIAADSDFAALDARQKRIEVLCNRFASQFLVPEAALSADMRNHTASPEMAEQLAALYSVSREVIYRRFLNRDWITQSEYTRASNFWKAQRLGKTASGGGNHYYTKLAYLGREYVGMVLRSYHMDRIDENQTANYLDTKPRNLASLEEYFLAGGQ